MYSPLVKQLIEALKALPGVGPKSAQRIAFKLLSASHQSKGLTLALSLQEAIERIGYCNQCRNYSEELLCELCQNPKRDPQLICVVESPADVIAIEQTHSFKGRYFVLHGHLSPLDHVGPNDLHIPLLFEQLQDLPINELILACNSTMEGRATSFYISNHLENKNIRCTQIAHGVPLGGELEYLDGGTVAHAFMSRQVISNQETTHNH